MSKKRSTRRDRRTPVRRPIIVQRGAASSGNALRPDGLGGPVGGPGAVLSARDLADGMVLADGVRIRLARAGDAETARRLIASIGGGVDLEDELAAAVEGGQAGFAVSRGLAEGADVLLRLLADGSHPDGEGSVQDVLIGLTCVLVADHPADGVVGALLALPPAGALSHPSLPDMEALIGLVKVVKLKAVAVDPAHRRSGIGAVLIRACCQLYTQLDYATMYGQIRVGTGLEPYYRRLGFTVLEEGEGIPLPMFSVPFGIHTEPGEQIFLRDLN